MASEYQAPVAFGAAQAYLRSIESAYDLLEQKVRARNSGGRDPISTNPGEIAPIVSGVAFALELLLKVLHLQEFGAAARGHDLSPLWERLSDLTRERIERRYCNAVQAWAAREGLPFVLVNTTGAPVEFEPAPLATCASALERIGRSFEQWRYMYELMKPGGGHLYFNFADAYATVDALRAEIQNYPGNAVVNVTVEPTTP